MWVLKFPNGEYYYGNMMVTPYLMKAKIFRSEGAAKGAMQGFKLTQLTRTVGIPRPQYVQLIEV